MLVQPRSVLVYRNDLFWKVNVTVVVSFEIGDTTSMFSFFRHVWDHLILLPGSEEVDRAILSLLDNRPASLSPSLFTPGLQQSVGSLWTQQIDPAGVLTRVQNMLAVTPRPWDRRNIKQHINSELLHKHSNSSVSGSNMLPRLCRFWTI